MCQFPSNFFRRSFSSSSGIGVEPLGMPRTLGADPKQPPAWQQSLHTLRLMRGSRGTGLVKGSSDQTGSVTNSMLCLLMAAVTTRHSWIPLWNRQLMTIDEKFCRNPRARNVICATKRKWCSFKTMQFSMDFHGFPVIWTMLHHDGQSWQSQLCTPAWILPHGHRVALRFDETSRQTRHITSIQ